MNTDFCSELRLEQLMPLIEEQLSTGHSVKFSPRGTSMRPLLRQGIDSVVLSPAPNRLKKFDLPLYRRENGQFVLHRVVKVAPDHYVCLGDNTFVPEVVYPHQILARTTALYRADRRVAVSSLPYRIYCRLWTLSRPLRHFMRRCAAHVGHK